MSSIFKECGNNINYKSISCDNIPELFLDKIIAKNHFSKFGKISKFILRPGRLQCTVDFEQEEEAKLAISNGNIFNGHEFNIRYTENDKHQVRNTEEWVDTDIQSELEAMGGVSQKQYRNQILPSLPYASKTLQQAGLRFPKPILNKNFNPNQIAPTEPINVEIRSTELTSLNFSLKNELESIMKKPALNATEKCAVLEARDKYLRLITTKTTDIKKAVSTKGTCPDMCPEKERLLRETRDQISNFELNTDGTSMNHKIAVKEYSRSSADQETPLAHELRSEPVLKMTMTYLLHCIMNQCDNEDVNIGDWFHFVWDRTRSIRKDITQQDLCSVDVVELVEQCARFHIHCAARLIAEDPSVFDQKINTENLTKCLQSLKYMYQDLRIKNIKCPNEPEFRAYIVLLNLNDANFLWEVKQFPEEITKSKEIKTAIDFYLAIENNNFVKFFKMFENTTYMNSCILMRYFNQVRISAIKTIVKAYTSPRQNTIQMPLNYLLDILLFESTEDAIIFFEHYGMECDYERVTLEKNWNYAPESPLQLDRYINVVESKRTTSVGESICGKPLISSSIFENHQPHTSFDNNGYLKQSAWTASYQNSNELSNNRKSLKQASDSVFKVPTISPPISPRQQQQIKSLFGLGTQKISKLSFPDNIYNEQKTKPVNSIFGSNKLSPVSNSSIFNLAQPNENDNKTSKSIFDFPKSSDRKMFAGDSLVFDDNNLQEKQSNLPPIFNKTKESIFNTNTFSSISSPKTESKSIFAISNDTSNNQTKGQSNKVSIFASASKLERSPNQHTIPNIFSNSQNQNQFPNNVPQLLIDSATGKSLNQTKENSNDINRGALFKQATMSEKTKFLNQNDIPLEKELKLKQTIIEEKLAKEKELLERKTKELEQKRLELEKQEKLIKTKKLETIQRNSEHILSELFNEVEKNLIHSIVRKELAKIKKEIDSNAKSILQNLCNEFIAENLVEIIQLELKEFSKNQSILRKYFEIWRNSTVKSIERRFLIQKTQNWALPESIEAVAKRMAHPTQNMNLEMIHRYRLGISKVFNVSKVNTLKKINIFSILSNAGNKSNYFGSGKSKTYLKFVISLPDDNEEIKGFSSYISSVLDESIERKIPRDLDKGFMCESDSNFAICIQKISENSNIKPVKKCENSNGLLFFFTLDDLFTTHKRLFNLLYNSKVNSSLPLSLLFYKSDQNIMDSEIINILTLKELKERGKISNYKLFPINDNTIHENLINSMKFIGNNLLQNNKLEMQSSISFFQNTISDEIWERFNDSWNSNPLFQLYCVKPQNVIELYNSAITKLIDILKEDLSKYPEFPEELYEFVPTLIADIPRNLEYFPKDWKNEQRYRKICNFLKKLRLKTIKQDWPNNIKQLEISILSYSQICIPKSESRGNKAGYSAIKVLLEKLNMPKFIGIPIEDRLQKISWLEIIRPITSQLLQEIWYTEHESIPKEIIYPKEKFDDYSKLPWWLEELHLKKISFNFENNLKDLSDVSEIESKNEINDEENLDIILNKGYNLIDRANDNIEKYYDYINLSREITKDLDLSLHEIESKKLKTMSNRKRNDFEMKNYSSPPKLKKFKQNYDEIQDVITKALSVIEKVESRINIRSKYD